MSGPKACQTADNPNALLSRMWAGYASVCMCIRKGGPSFCRVPAGLAECCRKCTVRRVGASYKASGPDASGAYDASYSVVQGVGARRVGDVRRVVQCRTRCRTVPTPYDTVRHSTTQYDTVRHSTTQYDTVRHSTTQYDTVRHGTTQYDTVRHTQTCTYVDI